MVQKTPIDNASEIIERFGGIRPMASKIDVAVTTVQGWKKRDAIPANRRDLLLAAAAAHNIDLSGVVKGASAANENSPEDEPEAPVADSGLSADKPEAPEKVQAETAGEAETAAPGASAAFGADMPAGAYEDLPPSFIASMLHDDIVSLIVKSERRAVIKSTWTTIFLIILTVGAIGFVLWPAPNALTEAERTQEIERLQALEAEINTIKDEIEGVKSRQGFFGRVIPEDLDARLGELQSKVDSAVDTARTGAQSAVDEARAVAGEALSGQTEALQQRLGDLEARLGSMTELPLLSALTQRYEAFTVTAGGQNLLQSTTAELSGLLSGVDVDADAGDAATANDVIAKAREESPVLSQSFEGVPADDLKAAALLLTMTQLRSTLNRPGESFATDLGLLRKLVGGDNAPLLESIDRLSPHADSGVLTPGGLSDELKGLTGEIVVASLQGEDVSFADRAKVRLNSVFQVEKDGALVTGTPTQAAVVEAQSALQAGDLLGAITKMQTLNGPAAQVAAPWIDQAKATLIAQQLKATLSGALSSTAAGISQYTAGGLNNSFAPSELIVDPISGVSVLKRSSGGFGGAGNALPNLPSME